MALLKGVSTSHIKPEEDPVSGILLPNNQMSKDINVKERVQPSRKRKLPTTTKTQKSFGHDETFEITDSEEDDDDDDEDFTLDTKKKKVISKPKPPKKQKQTRAKALKTISKTAESLKNTSKDANASKTAKPSKATSTSKSTKKMKTELPRCTEILDQSTNWQIENVLADTVSISSNIAKKVMNLLDEGNTIPFIARYRKDMTNNMEAKKLNEVADTYESLRTVQEKIATVVRKIDQQDKMTPQLLTALRNVKTLEEIEFLYYPYKTGSKKTLAETARNLGLEPLALNFLDNGNFNIQQYVQPEVKGLSNLTEVENGVKHILADIISKNHEILDALKIVIKEAWIKLETHESKTAKNKLVKVAKKAAQPSKLDESYKFKQYFEFSWPVHNVKPYQVLAINRGESYKVLSVKLIFPPQIKNRFEQLCKQYVFNKCMNNVHGYSLSLISSSIDDSYKRLVEPLMCRNIRSELTKNAERASVDVFVTNLRQLLLTPPVRGKTVLGIDPGFKNGCKIGVTSATGEILHTDIIYLPMENFKSSATECKEKLKNIISQFRCEVIAIGNGTACRETEELVSTMISSNELNTELVYCIVNESGASIYSTTDEAAAEMPNLDVNLRSAVSIARRLQDPLAEYVKVEPKHLGVGMYQHDLPEAMLKKALDSVVVECVSFVGVDLNTGSEALLRKVAGLNVTRAKNIIEWRTKNGPFVNREELKSVKNLGPKSFEQCAGFIRILPITSNSRDAASKSSFSFTVKKANLLDATCIHPESYHLAMRFLDMVGMKSDKIGKLEFIHGMKVFVQKKGLNSIASELDIGVAAMELIVHGLTQPLDYDMRSEFEKPLFRKGIISVDDLEEGTILTGRIMNIVEFGAFVDIGVGINGLLHKSKMGKTLLQLGDKVEVSVISVEPERKRIGLLLLQKF